MANRREAPGDGGQITVLLTQFGTTDHLGLGLVELCHLGADGHPAGILPLHGDDVVHGVTAAQAALIVADDHGNPAVALVVQVVDGLGQLVLLDGNRQLVLALPLDLLDSARHCSTQGLDVAFAATSVVLLFRFCHGANSPHLSWSGN